MIKIDVKDRKLLYYLSENARYSDTQLSKKIGLSKNAIKHRIQRLTREGVIKHFASVVHLGAIGSDTFTILLTFNEDIYEKPEILDFFKHHEFVDWAVSLSGQWDLFVEFVADDIYHLGNIVQGIVNHFGEIMQTYQIYTSGHALRVEHLISDFYEDLELPPLPHKKRTREKHKIDAIDRKLLFELNKNSAASYVELAEGIGASIDIVRYRMKQLIEKDILIKFFPEVSLKKLGYTEYLYFMKLRNISQSNINKLKQMISANHSVTYAFFDILSFNLIFVCAFKTSDEIDSLSRMLRKKFGSIIEKQEFMLIKEQLHFNLFPKGLLGKL